MFAGNAYQLYMNMYGNNIKYAKDENRNRNTQTFYISITCFFSAMGDGSSLAEMCFNHALTSSNYFQFPLSNFLIQSPAVSSFFHAPQNSRQQVLTVHETGFMTHLILDQT